jgi:small conductance mechanosensitive channel
MLEPLEVFGVDDFKDSEVTIKARLKTIPLQQWTVGREYRRRLKKAFDACGIEIPFPHRSLYMGDASRPFEVLLRRPAHPAGAER